MFSTVAAQIYIPTNNAWGFPFLHIHANTCYLLSFWLQPFWQVWGAISLWFWFAFSWWLAMLIIFSCACWSSVCLLWKNDCSSSLPIFILNYLFVWYWVVWVLYILDINPLSDMLLVNIFSLGPAFPTSGRQPPHKAWPGSRWAGDQPWLPVHTWLSFCPY